MKKISELTNKNFLNAAGATANSYVLINYDDTATNQPVTYKTSIDTLGKAIAKNLNLVKESNGDLKTVGSSQSTYTEGNAQVKKIQGFPVLFYDSNNGVGYKNANNSEVLANLEDLLYFDAERALIYNVGSSTVGYYSTPGVSDTFTEVSLGGNPYSAEVSGTQTQYAFYDTSFGLLISDSEGNIDTVLGQPLIVEESQGEYTFKAGPDGSEINLKFNPATYVYPDTSATFVFFDAEGHALDAYGNYISTFALIGESSGRPAIYDGTGTFKGYLATT